MVRTETVDTLLGRATAAGLLPCAVATWRVGEDATRVAIAGCARLRPRAEAVSASHWFDLASLTKPLVTAALVLIARRRGLLDLSCRLGDLFEGTGGIGHATILELLTHTSGLPAWLPLATLAEGDPSRALERLLQVKLVAPPGRSVVYSCAGFVVLGAAVERCLGTDLASAFTCEIAHPLGLTGQLGFRPGPGTHELVGGATDTTWERRLAAGLGLGGDRIPDPAPGLPDDGNARFLGGAAGNAGLFGTAAGVLGLASVWLEPGRLLEGDEIELATRNHTPGLEQARGLGWQLAASRGCSAGPALAGTAYGHTGFTGTSVWVDPSQHAVLVLLGNRHHPNPRPVDLHPLRRRFHSLACTAYRHS